MSAINENLLTRESPRVLTDIRLVGGKEIRLDEYLHEIFRYSSAVPSHLRNAKGADILVGCIKQGLYEEDGYSPKAGMNSSAARKTITELVESLK